MHHDIFWSPVKIPQKMTNLAFDPIIVLRETGLVDVKDCVQSVSILD